MLFRIERDISSAYQEDMSFWKNTANKIYHSKEMK